MIRMMKHYHTPLHDASIKAHKVSFSSYPGMLESLDDFYMMDSGLAMVQTTNSMMNTTLYDVDNNTSPRTSVLAWQRVRVASLLAGNGPEWHANMGTMNSGTYENQYMVVDFNLYLPSSPLRDMTLTIGEQTPGLYEWTDQTTTLARGYCTVFTVNVFCRPYTQCAPVPKKYVRPNYMLLLRNVMLYYTRLGGSVVAQPIAQPIHSTHTQHIHLLTHPPARFVPNATTQTIPPTCFVSGTPPPPLHRRAELQRAIPREDVCAIAVPRPREEARSRPLVRTCPASQDLPP